MTNQGETTEKTGTFADPNLHDLKIDPDAKHGNHSMKSPAPTHTYGDKGSPCPSHRNSSVIIKIETNLTTPEAPFAPRDVSLTSLLPGERCDHTVTLLTIRKLLDTNIR